MRVDGIIYADRAMLEALRQDQAPEQVANVATLPGIVGHSLAMPDIHWGYGFPIGGVAAMDAQDGVISPGGVGYDINCGVRLLLTGLGLDEVQPEIKRLMGELFHSIPSGVGSTGKIKLDKGEMRRVLEEGAAWAVSKGFGWAEDLERIEEGGSMAGADAGAVSDKAYKRGSDQLGTLGSGNHFLEVDVVAEVYEPRVAEAFGLQEGQVAVLIHSGSRGLGHQVCTDYIRTTEEATRRYGISVPDRQLACAPLKSPEGQAYYAAMVAACNYAWANRQCLTHWTREVFARVFGRPASALGLRLLYDQAHNIAKFEEHEVEGRSRRLCVHRKGASRAFPAGRPEVPAVYRKVGQPVLVPGDMGTTSYVMVGTDKSLRETWGSACHGAGRVMSRGAAKREVRGSELREQLLARGILVKAVSDASLAEEAPGAYKDVTHVVNICHGSGIARRVARLKPIGVMKG
ncbi:MAG: RtcB family protein [Acetobacteraceae bacterium]|nr:RtcB family protein [Acetobacteraceae bacterium]